VGEFMPTPSVEKETLLLWFWLLVVCHQIMTPVVKGQKIFLTTPTK